MSRVLVGDNNPEYLKSVQEYISATTGLEVIAVDSPAKVREAISKQKPDIVILDYHLLNDNDETDNSGLILAKSLSPETPKILVTSDPKPGVVDEVLMPGRNGQPAAIDFVSKREGPAALVSAVKNALDSKQAEIAKESGSQSFISGWLDYHKEIALSLILMAMGSGILSIIFMNPRWLLGTVSLCILAVFFVGLREL